MTGAGIALACSRTLASSATSPVVPLGEGNGRASTAVAGHAERVHLFGCGSPLHR